MFDNVKSISRNTISIGIHLSSNTEINYFGEIMIEFVFVFQFVPERQTNRPLGSGFGNDMPDLVTPSVGLF